MNTDTEGRPCEHTCFNVWLWALEKCSSSSNKQSPLASVEWEFPLITFMPFYTVGMIFMTTVHCLYNSKGDIRKNGQ